jgi:hypothetical protein
MSLYNLLFGKNPQSALLLAVIGLKEHDVPRFRNVFVGERDGKPTIDVYTRMGGGNRGHWDSYEGDAGPDCSCPGCRASYFMRAVAGFRYDEDDDFDCTYRTFVYAVPEEFERDVPKLADLLSNGLRKRFGQHLLKTLNRESTEADKEDAALDVERTKLKQTQHFMANGHTFVPKSDASMLAALELAEANGGELRSCWGILPLVITVKTDFKPWPNAKDPEFAANLMRVELGYDWRIDEAYWRHCQERWSGKFPLTMAKIAESVEQHLARAAA